MAWQALYRRYRSRRFADVVGQEHVVAALRNAVRDGRVGHAYLFSGPRGTGKTSCARILAKALNCERPVEGEPCLECESCRSIEAGTSYDVHELDAASNNGVEAMRELITRAALGTPGRTKVYILDEVHMLSAAASAALLKTLEEPPAHVVFVLATTDPQKVLDTIRSRTQQHAFTLLPADALERHVRWVAQDAGLDLGPDPDAVIAHVLRAGGGSARDTLSALDQVVSAGGIDDRAGEVDSLLAGLLARDPGAVLAAVHAAAIGGRDVRVLGQELVGRLRDAFLHSLGVPLGHLPDSDREQVAVLAERVDRPFLTRSLEVVGEALVALRDAADPRITLETALVRLADPTADTSVAALLERIERLERQVASGVPAAAATPAAAPAAPPPAASGESPAAEARRKLRERSAPGARASEAPAPGADREAPGPGPASEAPAAGPGTTRQPDGPAAAGGPTNEAAGRGEAQAAGPSSTSAAAGDRAAAPSPTSEAPAAGPSSASAAGEARAAGVGPASEPAGRDETPAAGPGTGRQPDGPTGGAAAAAGPTGEAPGRGGAPAPAASGAAGGGLPGLGELVSTWAERVLGALPGTAKARFAGGSFVEVTAEAAIFGLPNDMHRQRCEEHRPAVEAALAAAFGRAVPLRLVVAAGAGRPVDHLDDRPPPPAGPGPDDAVDLTELRDADDAPPSASAAERLAQAFPGSELLEDT